MSFFPSLLELAEIELLAQCVLFFLVGYETTASTLTFLAYELALNPEWQDKLIEEVDKVFEKHSEMSYDTVRDMKVLDAVVSETLRMYPVAIA
ncbi:cytochrome P450 3A8 [Trichonephila inaurata madagascariensis]|uniref:Cytochrome P450 3A8 n=1 Tax=Trichonephila inaurata madagascariensis TaxID=2747483 RepID=A0A8X7C6K5_9ARAC|nr:cytochrome P450 3A8 [Trichonephila inaurata madagascariensis]